MKKVTYFDVEYANPCNMSICQIGIVCDDLETGEPYYPERNIYLNPQDGFSPMCVNVHGITADRVCNEKTFPEVWKEIEPFFTNSIVIGHNVAAADLCALEKNLRRYNIDIPEFYYVCTLELSKEFLPRGAVKDYGMATLCEHFGIDIDNAHDAFDDACANADLFRSLVSTYNICIDDYVKKFSPHATHEYTDYISSPEIRRSISEFYGTVRGISIDNEINESEVDYIRKWRDSNVKYSSQKEIRTIVQIIDCILSDGVVTQNEMIELQHVIKEYLDTVSTAAVTLSTQILDGILKGIASDGIVTDEECRSLRIWLYDNIYLMGHFPFDKLMSTLDEVLLDGVVTTEESEYVYKIISGILNPIEEIKEQVNTVVGKRVCLTGVFKHGDKADVEKYIVAHGGTVTPSVTKKTDILLVGDFECAAYSNGTYGTKIKKAIEYNQKGGNIQIVKESDFFSEFDWEN